MSNMQTQTDAISNWALKRSESNIIRNWRFESNFLIHTLGGGSWHCWLMCSFEALCIFVHFAYTICNSNFLLRPGSQTGCRQVGQVIWPGSTGWGQGQGRNLHGYRSPCITHWFCTTWLTSTHLQKKCMHWHLFFRDRTWILALENTWRSSKILRSCPESALLFSTASLLYLCIFR